MITSGTAPSPIQRGQFIFMMVAMTIAIGTLILDSMADEGWVSAMWWGYGFFAVYVAYAVVRRDAVIGRLAVFGVVAGIVELISDWYLVSITGTLHYPHPEPMLLDSPAYMPFSWAVVLIQIGYVALLIGLRWNWLWTGLALIPLSGILIPLYENWAIHAGWWSYSGAPALWGVPYYIYMAEALLMFPVPFFLARLEGRAWPQAVIYGIAEGAVMLVACLIAFTLVG